MASLSTIGPFKARNARLVGSIAFAEGVSSAVSIGSVIAVIHHTQALAPVQNFIAERIVLPIVQSRSSADADTQELRNKAQNMAGLLTKGAVMTGVGFATHLPVQLALGGGFHLKEFRQAAFGKSLGMASAIAGVGMLNTLAPGLLDQAQARLTQTLIPSRGMMAGDDRSKAKAGETSTGDVSKLAMLELPSSIISGLINYRLCRVL